MIPCQEDPERWVGGTDDASARLLCRGCSMRLTCARKALETPCAQGIWGGIFVPPNGRSRRFALEKLRHLQEVEDVHQIAG